MSLPRWVRFLLWFAGGETPQLKNSSPALYLARMANDQLKQDLVSGGMPFNSRIECVCGSWKETYGFDPLDPCKACGRPDPRNLPAVMERQKAQDFFSGIANEMRRPSFGEMQAGFMRALLLRAQEAKLYNPEIT